MSTSRQRLNPPPRQPHAPLTPTPSPRIPAGWPAHQFPLPPHPTSPPPTPPVSAGLTSNLPSATAPITPAIFVGGEPAFPRNTSISSSDSDSFSDRYSFESSRRPRRHVQQQQQQQRPRRRRRDSVPTSPRQVAHVTEAHGSSSSSDDGRSSEEEDDEGWSRSLRTSSGTSATVLRLDGVGAVVIEAPQRAVSAKAAGGTRLVDARRPSGTLRRDEVADALSRTAGRRGRAAGQQDAGRFLSEPGPGLSGNERVRRTLQSKRMEGLRMGRTTSPLGDADEFEERALPSTPLSMQPTPRELYYPYDNSACSSPASRSPSPMRTPPPTTSLPLSFPAPPTHLPVRRPSLRPLSGTSTLVDGNIDSDEPGSAYPLTPIANDLGSLAIIAGLEAPAIRRRTSSSRSGSRPSRSAYSSRSRTYTNDASRSSSVSTTSIRLRSGSVVTVIPPEQTAWQRTAYVAGPIRLNTFSNLATTKGAAALPGLPHPPQQQPRAGRLGSVASLDAFQQAVETLPNNQAEQGRRASDESVLEGLVEYFEDFGFGYEKESLDCLWPSDVHYYANDNRKSCASSVGSGWSSPPPEKPVPAVPANPPAAVSKPAKRLSALSSGMEAVETQDKERDSSSLKRTPSLLSRGNRNSVDRKSRASGQNGQRTKLRRLMMSAGGIL